MRGTGGGRSLLLNAHMDTVGVAGMERPHDPVVEGNRLYGRGAFDMKGGLAAIMVAIAQAKKLSLRGDVILTAVTDEEYASIGTEAIVKQRHADAAIVTESTELSLCVAHKGFITPRARRPLLFRHGDEWRVLFWGLGTGDTFLHDRTFTFLSCMMNIGILTPMLYFCYSTLTME